MMQIIIHEGSGLPGPRSPLGKSGQEDLGEDCFGGRGGGLGLDLCMRGGGVCDGGGGVLSL